MLLVVLPQQILAVVVAVRRPDHRVDVLGVRHVRIHQVAQRHRPLMIELDQHDRTVDAVVEHAARFGVADPREPRAVQECAHLVHLHPRVAIVHVVDVERDEIDAAAGAGPR